ncbi:hypothetical protein RIR_jg30456.t1 [Rhizophagus irregularis DAOM 181602=DAOM 197198]|nr:hypothetical protein RIR_jg30456.t1 [Rhizophagus irregularis DAOM 181602=DAOM 197198]
MFYQKNMLTRFKNTKDDDRKRHYSCVYNRWKLHIKYCKEREDAQDKKIFSELNSFLSIGDALKYIVNWPNLRLQKFRSKIRSIRPIIYEKIFCNLHLRVCHKYT